MHLGTESLFTEAESSKNGLVPDKAGGGTKALGDSGFPGFLITDTMHRIYVSLRKLSNFCKNRRVWGSMHNWGWW